MDGVQRLLIIVIIVLTSLLFLVGIQVVLIILDLRKALRRLNRILEDALFGGGLIRPDKLTGILELFRKNKKLGKIGQGEIREPGISDE